jgi:glycosyltransferase involved in cell wall biosynthesis
MTDSPRRRPLILITLPDLSLGGGQRIVLNYVRHHDRSAFDVRILTLLAEPDDLAGEFADQGVDVTILRALPGERGALRRVVGVLRRDRIDLVHTHGPADKRLLLLPALATRVPVLYHLHSEWYHRGPLRVQRPPGSPEGAAGSLRRAVADGFYEVRAVTKGKLRDLVEDRVVREYLADSPPLAFSFRARLNRPVYAMSQSVPLLELAEAAAAHDDDAWRAELGLGPGPVAINVSRLEAGKGQDRIIRAMAFVRRHVPDAQLLLVGDGDQRPACEHLVDELGLRDRVHFLGNRLDVPRLLAGVDVFAFGSRTESFGLVVAEAMAARLPVVAYHLPSLADFATDAVTGYFPDQDDDMGFAHALADLLADRTKARKLGEAGYEVVSERFPPDATARSFEAAYRRILGPAAFPRRPGTLTVTTAPRAAAWMAAPPHSPFPPVPPSPPLPPSSAPKG